MISYGNIFELSLLLPTIVPYETFPFSVSLQLQQQQQQNKNASFSNINIEMILRHDLTQFYLIMLRLQYFYPQFKWNKWQHCKTSQLSVNLQNGTHVNEYIISLNAMHFNDFKVVIVSCHSNTSYNMVWAKVRLYCEETLRRVKRNTQKPLLFALIANTTNSWVNAWFSS